MRSDRDLTRSAPAYGHGLGDLADWGTCRVGHWRLVRHPRDPSGHGFCLTYRLVVKLDLEIGQWTGGLVSFRWMYLPQFGFYVAHTPCMHCYHHSQSPTKHACMHAQQQPRSSASTSSWTGGLGDWGTCTEITLSTRPPGTHRPRTAYPSSQDPARPTRHPPTAHAQVIHSHGSSAI